jgi:hypothetical protein
MKDETPNTPSTTPPNPLGQYETVQYQPPTIPTVSSGDAGSADARSTSNASTPYEVFTYGALCTWAGPISKAGQGSPRDSIPGCPFCGGPLYQFNDPARWWQPIAGYDLGYYPGPHQKPHPGYEAMFRWAYDQPKCWPTVAQLRDEYKTATGLHVEIE